MSQKIPFVDLRAQYQSLKQDIDKAIAAVIADTAFVGGRDNKYVRAFEDQFAAFAGLKQCISCANGTDAIEILLQAGGVGPGDEVIVPAHTWISTAESVTTIGAKPVFIDSSPGSYTMDPARIAEKITPRTKAIVPVHLYGMAADMDPIMALAKRHGLFVLEDTAQAHGATYKGKPVGTFGNAASFSFYPGKNLGAYGDAGAMATNDAALADKARRIANHGQLQKHDHAMEGRNSRLDGLQAAILSAKIPHLARWNAMRAENAARYDELLKNAGVETPKVSPGATHVYHLYVVQSDDREKLRAALTEAGVSTGIHYPSILPLLPPYRSAQNARQHFPVSARDVDRILSLPMYPEMTAAQARYVADCIEGALVA